MNKKIIISVGILAITLLLGGLIYNFYYQKRLEKIESEAKNSASEIVEAVFSYNGLDNYTDNLEKMKELMSKEVYEDRVSAKNLDQIKKLEEEYGYRVTVEINSAELRQKTNNLFIYAVSATETTFYDKIPESEEYSLILNYEIEIQYINNDYLITKILRLDDAGEEE